MTKTRFALLALLCVVLVAVGLSCVYRVAWSDIQRTDYTVYTAAGQALLDHSDLYAAQNSRGWRYVYPPPFALLMIPFAKMSLALGATIWYLLEVMSIAAVSMMSVKMLQPLVQDRHKDLLYSLPLFSFCVILVSGAMRCQASIFMFTLMVATFYFHFAKNPIASGMSLAAAILMKVFPVVLVAYFAWRRQWRVLLSAVAGLLVMGMLLPGLVLGWQQNVQNIERWVDVVGRPALMSNSVRAANTPLFEQLMDTRKPRNQSLESVFLTAGVEPTQSRRLVYGLAALMLLVMLWVARKSRSYLDELSLAGAFLAWCLLIPPISEAHYFGALIMPLTVLLGRVLYEDNDEGRRSRRLGVFGYGGVMVLAMLLLSWESTERLRPLALATFFLWGASIYSILRARSLVTNRPGRDI